MKRRESFGRIFAALKWGCDRLWKSVGAVTSSPLFCFYNGNTFVAVGRTMIQDVLRKLTPVEAQVFRSVVGHYIAGTAGDKELDAALVALE